MKIMIGCPVYKRAWILPTWFEFIEKQTVPLEDLGFVFELGTNDPETHDALWNWQQAHPQVQVFDAYIKDDVLHTEHPKHGRMWNGTKYHKMVELRNSLLDRVISHQPDRFFSLDSDILLEHPETLERLYAATEGLDAVSILTHMKPDSTQFPSVMSWIKEPGGKATRKYHNYPIGSMFKSDVIMAAVMMSTPVYNKVRYKWHSQGEDLGWSANAYKHGFQLWCASNIYGAHIMHDYHLEPYLNEGDPRSTNKF